MAFNKSEYEPRPLGANVPKGRGSFLLRALFVTASDAGSGGFGKGAGARWEASKIEDLSQFYRRKRFGKTRAWSPLSAICVIVG